MGTIYSQPLGWIQSTDAGTLWEIYMVPASSGPAVVRSATLYGAPGTLIVVWAYDPDSGYLMVLGEIDNTDGASAEASTLTLYQPLSPGWKIYAANQSSPGNWSVILGGYQFSSP